MQPHTSLSLSQNLGCFNAIGETVLNDRYKDFVIHNQRILMICLGFLNSTCCQNMTTWTWLDVVQPTMQDPNCAHTRPKCPHLVFNRDQNCQFAGVSGKSAHWILCPSLQKIPNSSSFEANRFYTSDFFCEWSFKNCSVFIKELSTIKISHKSNC